MSADIGIVIIGDSVLSSHWDLLRWESCHVQVASQRLQKLRYAMDKL